MFLYQKLEGVYKLEMYKTLIVEDEDMIRNGLKYMIDWVSLDCVIVGEAANGEEGLHMIEELEPDILLLDINMPVKNGLVSLEESVDEHLFSTIIISGYDEFEYAKKAISYGVEEYLLKPVEPNKLHEAIERAKESVQLKKRYELIKQKLITPDDVELLSWDIWRKIDHKPKHVKQMLNYIEQNYHKKITMDDLVEVTGKSATYLYNLFKESTNHTFNDFLNRYRIQKAIERIRTGEEKISMIALDVGFSSYRYFIKVFKKYTNALPSDFFFYFEEKDTE